MMFFPEPFRHLEHVDSFVVFHAGECLRAKAFFGKKIESCAAHPLMHESIRPRVTSVTRFKTFLENLIKLRLERMNLPDARRARRHELSLLVLKLQEIEIKSAIRDFAGACKPLFRNGEQCKSWRECERLLCSGEHDVNP